MMQLRFFGKVVLFLLFAFVMYALLLAAVPQRLSFGLIRNLKVPEGRSGYSLTRYAEADQRSKVDVVFLGSSLTYRGMDVRIFEQAGYTAFNLGSSSQTLIQSEMLLKRYLDRMDPDLVVIEVTPNNLSRDGVESALDLIANSTIDDHTWRMTYAVGHLYAWNAALYRGMRQTILGPSTAKEALRQVPDTYIPGGFVGRDLGNKRHKPFMPGPVVEDLEFQYQALVRMLDLLQSEQKPFVLVDPIVSRPYYEHYIDLHAFQSKMRSLGPFLEMNELLYLDDSLDFYDSHHLEKSGVERYNAALIQELRNLGALPK